MDAVAARRYRPWDNLAGQICIGSKRFRAEVEATKGGRSKARRLYASLLQSEGLLTYVTNTAMAEHLGVGAWAASLLARGGEALAREERDFARKADAVRKRLRSSALKITE